MNALTNQTNKAINEYNKDGATVLRGVIDPSWITRLATASDELLRESVSSVTFSRPGEGRFFGDLFSWLHNPEFKAFILEAGLAEVAGTIMQSKHVRFFYDQLLVKEPNTSKPTPWHQDLPYWPLKGEQIISIWVPIDAASPKNGVVTYVRGSHLWNSFFPMESWSDNLSKAELEAHGFLTPEGDKARRQSKRSIADISEHPENYDFVTWDVEPGDVILHHPLAVHGAKGNLSSNKRRRALATRWCGDDITWDDSRDNFMRMLRKREGFPYPKLDQGQALNDPLFPMLWSQDI